VHPDPVQLDFLRGARRQPAQVAQEPSIEFDYLFLTGEKSTNVFAALPRYGLDQKKALKLGHAMPSQIYQEALDHVPSLGTVFGIGNVGAGGLDIVRYFRDQRANLASAEKGTT
jgi:hypothetical protein